MIYTQEIANHDLLRLDRAHVWHPYTSFTQPGMITAVSHAQGVELHLADGRVLIDGMSSCDVCWHHPRTRSKTRHYPR
jgi:adenosylmethionine-8-amino-7-oxononanoate aminotransferase